MHNSDIMEIDTPQQQNSIDCGVCVLLIMHHITVNGVTSIHEPLGFGFTLEYVRSARRMMFLNAVSHRINHAMTPYAHWRLGP